MSKELNRLNDVSLVARNYGDGIVLEDVLLDWFHFLGGKPGEVVLVDAGSNPQTLETYWNLYQKGLIDKLQIISPEHEEHEHEVGFVQVYTAAAIATKPYVFFFNIDTLPYRNGHENWLNESIDYLEREEVMAVGGSWNLPSKSHDAWKGWYYSYKCSLNFALMRRATFMAAVEEYAGEYVKSGFKGANPAKFECTWGDKSRFIMEVALEKYIERHQVYTLCKIEDPNWTVFHTNLHEERLQQARLKYLARKGISRYINLGYSDADPIPSKALYYGQKQMGLVKRLRVLFGQSQLGSYWRSAKQRLTQEPARSSIA